MIEPQKFYKCSEYHLLIYPTKEIATTVRRRSLVPSMAPAVAAAGRARYWSNQFNCKVNFSQKEDIFWVIEKVEEDEETLLFCLFPNFSGWVVYDNLLELEEIQND